MRVAVVGAGISGLAAAHRLVELDARVTLFEASDNLGGAVRTTRSAGYLIEHGGDMFITDKPWARALCERLGLGDRLVSPDASFRRAFVLADGKPEPVPEGFMLMVPTQIGSMVRTPILSPLGKLRMAGDLLVARREDGADESLADFVRRRLGREALERLVQPLVGGIYTGDPERLSLRATLPRFLEMERAHRSLIVASLRRGRAPAESGARYGLFVSLPGGLGELVERLVEKLRARCEVRTGTRVDDIAPAEEGYTVAGEHFEALVLALPAYASARLLRSIDASIADALDRIVYASTAIVVSGHDLADVRNPLSGSGLVIPAVERRRVLAVSYASRKFADRAPRGRVLLRTFVGGALQPELLEASDARIEALVTDELRALLGVEGKPDLLQVMRHPRSMPQYEVGHLDRVERIEADLARHPRLALAGNAFRGVGIPDCVHSGERAAERVIGSA